MTFIIKNNLNNIYKTCSQISTNCSDLLKKPVVQLAISVGILATATLTAIALAYSASVTIKIGLLTTGIALGTTALISLYLSWKSKNEPEITQQSIVKDPILEESSVEVPSTEELTHFVESFTQQQREALPHVLTGTMLEFFNLDTRDMSSYMLNDGTLISKMYLTKTPSFEKANAIMTKEMTRALSNPKEFAKGQKTVLLDTRRNKGVFIETLNAAQPNDKNRLQEAIKNLKKMYDTEDLELSIISKISKKDSNFIFNISYMINNIDCFRFSGSIMDILYRSTFRASLKNQKKQ